ncbi:hypothetical protein MNAN1_002626 [Malassezia nana]|uniref:Uncharacterized protein n=1 Tax=Malassezia nana TaxID=180528 RepID=A0AAF0J824_9BASI|nr:hypothetical protein MNAN1_002626 [Malassezia nana]
MPTRGSPAVVGTSDAEEAVGWASDSGRGDLVDTSRCARSYTLFGTVPRRARTRTTASRPGPSVPPAPPTHPSPPAPSPPAPRHLLRTRKIAQIHPYTIEALRYRRELYANNWEDAVVSQREWRRRPLLEEVDASPPRWRTRTASPSLSPPRRSASPSIPSESRSSPLSRSSPSPSAPLSPTSPSSSDSTDYERRFRVLKRMMPAHMARACIDDLRAMRHDTSTDSDDAAPARHRAEPQGALQPGESRRRRRHTADAARAPLLSDVSDSSDSEPLPPPSPRLRNADLRWWAVRRRAPSPVQEGDVIDRMLSRATAPRKRSRRAAAPRPTAPAHTGRVSRRVPRRETRTTLPAWLTGRREASPPPRKPAPPASTYVVPGPAHVQGVPTQRRDLAVRLPYVPPAQPALDLRREVRASSLLTTPTQPRRVVRGPLQRSTPEPQALPARGPLPTAWQAAPPEWRDELHELVRWDDLWHVDVDLGLAPPPVGVRFAADTELGRGRLHALLHRSVPLAPVTCLIEGQTLHDHMSLDDLSAALAALGDLDADGAWRSLLSFLSSWLTMQAARHTQNSVALADAFEVGAACELLCGWAQAQLRRALPAEPTLRLLWFRVEIQWRVWQSNAGSSVPVLDMAQPLVLRLLAHGLGRTLAHVAAADTEPITDLAAELWVHVIHALNAVDDEAFWDVLTAASDDYFALSPCSALVRCERAWLIVLGVCTFSFFSAAAGIAGPAPHLQAHWPTIQALLARVRLRYDAHVERAAPRQLLQKRDAYIHILLHRCFLLRTRWQWPLLHSDTLLRHLFDIFDAHALADLPSEQDHDFAPFLRHFDIARLLDAPPQGHAYQLFLQLLGRASAELACVADGRQRLARLFSRMTPVRVMPFTMADPPVSTERAMLFNHYSIVMLFLYFESGSALLRLRQIRSFLSFTSADRASQIACIRAMVYAGTLFRHHGLDVQPVVAWLVDVLQTLQADAAAQAPSAGLAARHDAQSKRELTRMMTVLVRSVQHLVEHPGCPGRVSYPPLALLHPAWTHELLQQAPPPDVAVEVLHVLRAFLSQREAARQPCPPMDDAADVDDEFDDSLLADPSLDALLGEAPIDSPDAALAAQLHTHVSPALFQCLDAWTCAPPADARTPLEALVAQAEAQARIDLLIDTWASCARVLVYHDRRDWRGYLTLGNESWKRLHAPVQKRHVAVRFAAHLAAWDVRAMASCATECVVIWFHGLAAYHVDELPAFTIALAPYDTLLPPDAPREAAAFVAARSAILAHVMRTMRTESETQPARVGFFIQCLSALLSSIRAHVAQTPEPAYSIKCMRLMAR